MHHSNRLTGQNKSIFIVLLAHFLILALLLITQFNQQAQAAKSRKLSMVSGSDAAKGSTVRGATERPAVTEENIGGKTFCISRLVVNAKAEHIWQILADYDNAPRVFSLLRQCKVLEDHGNRKMVRHELAPSGLPSTYEYIVEVHELPPRSMEWHRVSGDFKELDGFWKLEPVDCGNHTLVTYGTYANGGLFMPQALVRRQFHIDLPTILLSLKNRAEINTEIASRRTESEPTE